MKPSERERIVREAVDPRLMVHLFDRVLLAADGRVYRDGLSLKHPDEPCDEYRAQLRLAFPQFFRRDDEFGDRMPDEPLPIYVEELPPARALPPGVVPVPVERLREWRHSNACVWRESGGCTCGLAAKIAEGKTP